MRNAMKNSQIAMLSAVGIIVVVAIVLVATLRFVLVRGVDDTAASGPSAGRAPARAGQAAVSTNLRDFTEIELRNSWSVELMRGEDWNVELSYPEDLEQSIDAEVRGARLILDARDTQRRGWFWWGHDDEFEARITMPELTGIAIAGAGHVELAGFEGDSLDIRITGAGNIEGRSGRYERLDLRISGAGNVQFRGLRVANADVDLSGASNVELDMDGGELTGILSGFGNVTYSGPVSNEDVDVTGFGRVARQ
jgi:hypothetical protein